VKPHIKNYFKAFGYDESSRILCEYCGSGIGVEIHHVEPRSSFGSKRKDEQDHVDNLIALCRLHHHNAHDIWSRNWKIKFKEIVRQRMNFT